MRGSNKQDGIRGAIFLLRMGSKVQSCCWAIIRGAIFVLGDDPRCKSFFWVMIRAEKCASDRLNSETGQKESSGKREN